MPIHLAVLGLPFLATPPHAAVFDFGNGGTTSNNSQNGGHVGPTDNDPLRHRKGSFRNGGLRVPMIIRRPGAVPASAQTDTLVHSVDFYPSLLEHAGVPLPSGIIFDGESFAPHMLDPAGNRRDRSPIYHHFPGYLDQRARPVEAAGTPGNWEPLAVGVTADGPTTRATVPDPAPVPPLPARCFYRVRLRP